MLELKSLSLLKLKELDMEAINRALDSHVVENAVTKVIPHHPVDKVFEIEKPVPVPV